MGNLRQQTTGGKVGAVGRVVPVGEIRDEVEQGAAQFLKVIEQRRVLACAVEPVLTFRGKQDLPFVRRPFLHGAPRGVEKFNRASRVGWIGPEGREDHRPTGGKRAARPPDVQGRDVPVTDAFLAPCMRRDAFDREVDFDEAFRVIVHVV